MGLVGEEQPFWRVDRARARGTLRLQVSRRNPQNMTFITTNPSRVCALTRENQAASHALSAPESSPLYLEDFTVSTVPLVPRAVLDGVYLHVLKQTVLHPVVSKPTDAMMTTTIAMSMAMAMTATTGSVNQAESRRRGLRDGQPARFVGAEHRRRRAWGILHPRLDRRTPGIHCAVSVF